VVACGLLLAAAAECANLAARRFAFMSAPTEPAPEVPVTQQREFCALMGYAVALGIFGAFAGLVFVGVIAFGGKWYAEPPVSWSGCCAA
jgi:hypothetical protein